MAFTDTAVTDMTMMLDGLEFVIPPYPSGDPGNATAVLDWDGARYLVTVTRVPEGVDL